MGPAQQPNGFWTKEVKVWTTIIVIVVVVLFGVLSFLITGFFTREPTPNDDPLPRSGLYVDVNRISGPSEAVDFQVLGNASGEQYLAIVTRSGSLYIYVSNDTFSSVVNSILLDEAYGTDPATVQLRLGRDPLGNVAVSISRDGEQKGWTLEAWPDSWVPMEDPSIISEPESPEIDPSSLPSFEALEDWETGWDTLKLEGRDVAVGTYSYWSGCEESFCSPSVVFGTADGGWSTIVVLGKQPADAVRGAGDSLDDMFVITYWVRVENPIWYIYVVDGEPVQDTGLAPPATGSS